MMHLPPDPEMVVLLTAAQRLDEAAFERLYTLYAAALFHFFHARVNAYHTAEDLTSSVFVRVVEALPKFRLPETGHGLAFTAWLFRIASNQLTDHYRRTKHQPEPLDEHWPGSEQVADIVERQLDRQELCTALSHLTPEQQHILLLRFVAELSLEEVAQRTGQQVGGVKSMQSRALRSLARLLQGARISSRVYRSAHVEERQHHQQASMSAHIL